MVKLKPKSLATKATKKLFPHLVEQNAKKRKYSALLKNRSAKNPAPSKTKVNLAIRTALAGLKLSPEQRKDAIKLGRRALGRYSVIRAWGKNPLKDKMLIEIETDIYDSIGIRTGAKFTSGLKSAYRELVEETL